MPKLDFSKAQSFDAIPIGVYDATVFGIELKKANTDGSDYYAWQFAIQNEGFKNRRVWTNTSVKLNALWKLKEMLEALDGVPIKGEFDFEPQKYFGRPCKIKLGLDEYPKGSGKFQNTVDTVYPVGAQAQTLTAGDIGKVTAASIAGPAGAAPVAPAAAGPAKIF